MDTIIITGHSSGLGKALAEHYLAAGAAVIGISRRKWPSENGAVAEFLRSKNEAAAAFLRSKNNALAEFLRSKNEAASKNGLAAEYQADLADNGQLRAVTDDAVFQTLCRQARRIVLINNAATLSPNCVAGQGGESEIGRAVALNIAAPLILSETVLALQAGACGKDSDGQKLDIVHLSSGAGRKAYPAWSVYGASKAALDQHARVIAAEAHPNVRIVSLAPGIIDTPMQAQIRSGDAESFPLLERFQALHRDGVLQSAAETAAQIAAFIESPDFGRETVADIREHWH